MYSIHLSREAKKYLEKSPQKTRLIVKLQSLAENPYSRLMDIKKLKGITDTYRLRVGPVRIVFCVKSVENVLQILDIDNRGDIY